MPKFGYKNIAGDRVESLATVKVKLNPQFFPHPKIQPFYYRRQSS